MVDTGSAQSFGKKLRSQLHPDSLSGYESVRGKDWQQLVWVLYDLMNLPIPIANPIPQPNRHSPRLSVG